VYTNRKYVSQYVIYAQVLLGVVKEWLVINQCLVEVSAGDWEREKPCILVWRLKLSVRAFNTANCVRGLRQVYTCPNIYVYTKGEIRAIHPIRPTELHVLALSTDELNFCIITAWNHKNMTFLPFTFPPRGYTYRMIHHACSPPFLINKAVIQNLILEFLKIL